MGDCMPGMVRLFARRTPFRHRDGVGLGQDRREPFDTREGAGVRDVDGAHEDGKPTPGQPVAQVLARDIAPEPSDGVGPERSVECCVKALAARPRRLDEDDHGVGGPSRSVTQRNAAR